VSAAPPSNAYTNTSLDQFLHLGGLLSAIHQACAWSLSSRPLLRPNEALLAKKIISPVRFVCASSQKGLRPRKKRTRGAPKKIKRPQILERPLWLCTHTKRTGETVFGRGLIGTQERTVWGARRSLTRTQEQTVGPCTRNSCKPVSNPWTVLNIRLETVLNLLSSHANT
jgi:hypothetical protein